MAEGREVKLGVSVDSSGAKAGFNEVKASGAEMANAVTAATNKAGKSVDNIGSGSGKAAGTIDRATRSMVQSIERTTAAFSAGSKSSSDYYRVLAQQRGIDPKVLAPYLAELDKVAPKQAAANAAIASAAPVLQKYQQSAKATAAALRQVPAQFTDIVVGLQGGQAPLTVLLQQGGQLKDVFGGIGNAARALGGYILGLISPFSIAAAVIGSLGVAFFLGRKESDEYRKTLILTGNAAGTTVGQLQAAAAQVAASTGATKGAAAEALKAFAATGDSAGLQLSRFADIAIRLQRTAGVAVADTVKQFSELGREPVSASIKLNEATNFLTLSVYQQIKALDDQGRSTEAAALAQTAYADAMEQRTGALQGNLGFLERAWQSIGDAAKSAWDKMLNVGRVETPETRIAALQEKLANGIKNLGGRTDEGSKRYIDSLKEQINLEGESVRMLRRAADSEADRARQVKARIAYDKEGESYKPPAAKMLQEIERAKNLAAEGGVSDADLATRIAAIRKKYEVKGPRGRKDNSAEQEAKAQLDFDIESIKNAATAQVNAYSNGEKILQSLRSAGLVSERDYYESKRQFLEQSTRVQVEAFDAETARLEQEKLKGKDKIQNDKKLIEIAEKKAKVLADAAASNIIMNVQEQASIAATVKAFEEARQAAQDYFDTTNKGYARDLAGAGLGDSERRRLSGRNQIEDKYSNQRQDVENKFLLSKDQSSEARAQYEQKLELIKEFEAKALNEWDDYYRKLKDKEADWSNGSSRAMQDYIDDAANVAKQSEKLFSNGFKGMEDALVTFVTTGKLSFTDLANSIVADITRIIIQQQISAAIKSTSGSGGGFFEGLLGGLLGGGTGGAGQGLAWSFPKAGGGYAPSGSIQRVNENGPELLSVGNRDYLMMGSQGGNVTPNGSIGGKSINITVNQAFGANTSRATTLQAAADARRQLELGARNA